MKYWLGPFWLLLVCLIPGQLNAQDSSTTPVYAFSHLAGATGGYGNADGPGPAARFWNPSGLALDLNDNLYVADSRTYTVRKITPSGDVSTLLTVNSYLQHGLTELSNGYPSFAPHGVAVDSVGNVYVTDIGKNAIIKLTPQGDLTQFAGQNGLAARLYHYSDGAASQAIFYHPAGLAIDRADNLYVADQDNNIIRKITPSGMVSTLAGMPPEFGSPNGVGANGELDHPGSADGVGTLAQFNHPSSIAVDAGGNLFVTDEWNNTIRKITPDGTVTTLAGEAGKEGSTDGVGAVARFYRPRGITVDPAGYVYVADLGNALIRRISPSGAVTTLAGKPGDYGITDGPAATARFVGPRSAVIDSLGDILIGDGDTLWPSDLHAGTIRHLSATGTVSTYVGTAGAAGSGDGIGTGARFYHPEGVATDSTGNVYVADRDNDVIRKITPDGTTTTYAGIAGQAGWADGTVSTARFDEPTGVAVDATGNVFVADHGNHVIRKVTPDGTVSTIAGQPGQPGAVDGIGDQAQFHDPLGICIGTSGNLYVTDGDYFPTSGDPLRSYGTVRMIAPDGTVSTLAGNPTVVYVDHLHGGTTDDGTDTRRRLSRPDGIAIDSVGNLFVADSYANQIIKIATDGTVTPLSDLIDEQGNSIQIERPIGIAIDESSNLYVSCGQSAYPAYMCTTMIKRITPSGVVSTIAGSPGVMGSTDGTENSVQFNDVRGIAIDAQGRIYAADSENNAIRLGQLADAPVISAPPQSQTVSAGANVRFSVTASGIPEPTYQWYFKGEAISGATDATYAVSNASSSDAGDYTVVVSNSLGSVTSDKATLTVNTPTPPPPSGGTGSSGGGGGGAPSTWFLGIIAALSLARWWSTKTTHLQPSE